MSHLAGVGGRVVIRHPGGPYSCRGLAVDVHRALLVTSIPEDLEKAGPAASLPAPGHVQVEEHEGREGGGQGRLHGVCGGR